MHPEDTPHNPEPWDALPGFRVARRQIADLKILVEIGFEPLGLPSLVESGELELISGG